MRVLWTGERDLALMEIINEIEADDTRELVPSVLTAELKDHPSFDGGDAERLTTGKVRDRINALRKRGAAIPPLSVDKYVPDVAALNAALAGEE